MEHKKKPSILKVIVDARELISYLFDTLEKSPKRFRFVFVNRIENYLLDMMEKLLLANHSKDLNKRIENQLEAGKTLMIIDELFQISKPTALLTQHQFEVTTRLIAQTQMDLNKWYLYTKKGVSTASNAD